jgi:hypothetical protein
MVAGLDTNSFGPALVKSTDGVSWQSVTIGSGFNAPNEQVSSVLINDVGTVLVGVGSESSINKTEAGTGIWRSIDGVTFARVLTNITTTGLAYGDGVWVAGTLDGFYRSVDDGLTWTKGASSCQTSSMNVKVAYGEDGVFLGSGTSGDHCRSADFGLTWKANQPLIGITPQTVPFRTAVYSNGNWLLGVGNQVRLLVPSQ